ncbi:hypothetical protein DV735_g2399, partial [Chaetothyriales sp. CBS 134920]
MASLRATLGLGTAAGTVAARGLSSASNVPNHAPVFLFINFILAYAILPSTLLKCWYGIHHNESPRYDLVKYGRAAVKSGRMTHKQLEMIQRAESAHADLVENYAFFVATMAFATFAGVDNAEVNQTGLVYTVAQILYGLAYILIDDRLWSEIRGYPWWVGNNYCLYLLLKAGQKLNQG